jgi:uncharacterized membrane protein YqjE
VIKETILKFLQLDNIMSHLTGYVEARIELMKIEIKEDVARAISKAAVFLMIFFAATLFVLFISIAIAVKIGERTGFFTGFAIVAAFYAVVGIVLWASREKMRRKMEHQFFENIKLKKK